MVIPKVVSNILKHVNASAGVTGLMINKQRAVCFQAHVVYDNNTCNRPGHCTHRHLGIDLLAVSIII